MGRLSRLRVRPGDLEATNTPADTQVPSYDAASSLFEWVAGGAGGAITFERITEVEVTSDVASVTINNIPIDYKHLLLISYAKTTYATSDVDLMARFNGDSAANYRWEWFAAVSTALSSGYEGTSTGALLGSMKVNGPYPGIAMTLIRNYDDGQACSFGGMPGGTCDNRIYFGTGRWTGTAKITSITIYGLVANLKANSKFVLLGLR